MMIILLFCCWKINANINDDDKHIEQEDVMKDFQLWINLPTKNKMDAPAYQDVPPEEIPTINTKNYSIRVITGEYNGVTGAIETKTPILFRDLTEREKDEDDESTDLSKQFFTVADSIS